jgi:hypothetical protein
MDTCWWCGSFAPGNENNNASISALSATAITRFAGLIDLLLIDLGLTPRLYADVRSAD